MRYTLRNQDKIKAFFEPYGETVLKRIIRSLDNYFANGQKIREEDIYRSDKKKHAILTVDDSGNSSGLILFCIISKKYDVVNLAFKEFVG